MNGEPPLGWDVAGRYLVLPVLLVVLQYISTALISPPPDPNQEESQKRTAQVSPDLLSWNVLLTCLLLHMRTSSEIGSAGLSGLCHS